MIANVWARHTGTDLVDTEYSRYVEQCDEVHAGEARRTLMGREKETTV